MFIFDKIFESSLQSGGFFCYRHLFSITSSQRSISFLFTTFISTQTNATFKNIYPFNCYQVKIILITTHSTNSNHEITSIIYTPVLSPCYCPAQSSVADIYEAHTFPCDSSSGTLEAIMCSGVKAEFVDSLLNRLYKEILKSWTKKLLKISVN
jgi:hypothetical protein